jgi:hypothetical protein
MPMRKIENWKTPKRTLRNFRRGDYVQIRNGRFGHYYGTVFEKEKERGKTYYTIGSLRDVKTGNRPDGLGLVANVRRHNLKKYKF